MDARIQLIDVFLRFAAIGQLALIAAVLTRRRPLTRRSSLLLAICPCLAGYLMLTALNELSRDYRSVFLVLTHLLPYPVWALGMSLFDERFEARAWPTWSKALVALAVLWHVYFFGFLEGSGLFHDLSHVLFLALFGHLVIVAVAGLADDLVEPRRRARLLLLGFASVQLLIIVVVELAGVASGDSNLVDVANAALFFLVISIVGVNLAGAPQTELLVRPDMKAAPVADASAMSPADEALHDALMRFMAAGGYRHSNLTIGRIARELGTREHSLRRLINTTLGFRNFSAFLNSYRIPEACDRLSDRGSTQTPVLTIALDLGYGSIGPFNRAFKAIVGRTPTEYRRQPQP